MEIHFRNTVTEMKNPPDGLSSRFVLTEDKISKHDRMIQII